MKPPSTDTGVEMRRSPQVSLAERSGGWWKLVAGDGQDTVGETGEKLEFEVALPQVGESP